MIDQYFESTIPRRIWMYVRHSRRKGEVVLLARSTNGQAAAKAQRNVFVSADPPATMPPGNSAEDPTRFQSPQTSTIG
jgi:hypothetical protein